LSLNPFRKLRNKVQTVVQFGKVLQFNPYPWLKEAFHVRTLIDIGANRGEYGGFLARHFDVEDAYFVEPLASARSALEVVAGGCRRAEILPFALSDAEGEATFYETDYAPSSSLLPPEERALAQFPRNAVKSRSLIAVRRLDDLMGGRPLADDLLVKIDVQGMEHRVIRGGPAVFARAKVVLIEMSFVPLYAGQSLFGDVHPLLAAHGLQLAGMVNQIMMPASRRPGFGHFIYIRS
jgi:FkbM family methyltransferase